MNKKNNQLLKKLIMEHFSEKEKYDLKNSSKKLTLAEPPFSWEEVYDALESMLEKRTTMGSKVKKFEEMLAESKRLSDELIEKTEEKIAVAQDKIETGKKVVTDKGSKLKQAIESGKEAFYKEKKTAKSKKA